MGKKIVAKRKPSRDNAAAYRAKARELYETDDCSFNHVPKVSESAEGAFVEAWLWIPKMALIPEA